MTVTVVVAADLCVGDSILGIGRVTEVQADHATVTFVCNDHPDWTRALSPDHVLWVTR